MQPKWKKELEARKEKANNFFVMLEEVHKDEMDVEYDEAEADEAEAEANEPEPVEGEDKDEEESDDETGLSKELLGHAKEMLSKYDADDIIKAVLEVK